MQEKEARALLKSMASDPHLRVASKSLVPHHEMYPSTWDHQLKNIRTTKNSLRDALKVLEFDSSAPGLPEDIMALMVAGREALVKAIGFECTLETPKSAIEYSNWRIRVTNLILDAVNACYKDSGLLTETLKILFTGSETKVASSSEADKALGYSFANEVLVDHPYRWDSAIDQYLKDIIDSNNPGLAARASNPNHPQAPTEECSKAQDQVLALDLVLETQIRKLQKINSNTLLVLMPWLIPNAREDKSPVFSRLKGVRATHISNERAKPVKDRVPFDGLHLLTHLESVYTVENIISRHTAWTNVLIGNRAPGMAIYDWLNHMDAVAQTFIDAGDAAQTAAGLNSSEKKEFLTIIGKQISDYEDTILLKVDPASFGQNKLVTGDYDLNDLKSVVAQNIQQIDKHKFKYCSRIREYVEHTYREVHGRQLPDHMLDKPVKAKKQKTDQLNFDSEPKAHDPKPKWASNNKTKDHRGGPFRSSYGRGKGHYNPNQWNHHPGKGKWSKGYKGKGKGKGRGKGSKGKRGKGKGKTSKGKHADKVCHHCGMKGHIKATCFKYLALQGNGKYQKAKAGHSPRVQLCIEILEDATGMDVCEHCFTSDCTPQTCIFPPEKHDAMVEAHALFYESDMYDTCLKTKTETWQSPHTQDWSDYNSQPHEEAQGYYHDYDGYNRNSWYAQNREGWTIEAEEQSEGYYTEEWFKKEEQRLSKKRKKDTSLYSKKLDKAEEASGGESSQDE